MIALGRDQLVFEFPEVHPHAKVSIEFQRTLRIPDDGDDYPLPPGLGRFPLRHVDDFADKVPARWRERGGIMLPMFQSEAMWLNFNSTTDYPFLVKIAAGKSRLKMPSERAVAVWYISCSRKACSYPLWADRSVSYSPRRPSHSSP